MGSAILGIISILTSLGLDNKAERLQRFLEWKSDTKESYYKRFEAEIARLQNDITKLNNSGAIATDQANRILGEIDAALNKLSGYYGKYKHIVGKDQAQLEEKKKATRNKLSSKLMDIERAVAGKLDEATTAATNLASNVAHVNEHAQELFDAHENARKYGDAKETGDMKSLEAALAG